MHAKHFFAICDKMALEFPELADGSLHGTLWSEYIDAGFPSNAEAFVRSKLTLGREINTAPPADMGN